MSFRFRPLLDTLESREVPASFSFTLPDGTAGSGTFLIPNGVDPAEPGQYIVTPMRMTIGGEALTTQPYAHAAFVSSEFVSLSAAATGSWTVFVDGGTAQVETPQGTSYTAAVTYDLSEVQWQFAFTADGTPGTIAYDVPWGQVDPAQASQSITPTGFRLNIAGQTIDSGFTTAPTLVFEYGNLVGVNFAVGALAGVGYSSLSMTGQAVTAIDAWSGQALFANAAPAGSGTLTLDFANITLPGAPVPGAQPVTYTLTVAFKTGADVTLSVVAQPGATAGDVRNLFVAALRQNGIDDISFGTTQLNIGGREKDLLKRVTVGQDSGFGNKPPRLVGGTRGSDGNLPEDARP